METFNFGQAIEHVKTGKNVARIGWNGKGMWIFLVGAGKWSLIHKDPKLLHSELAPFIAMKTATHAVTPWLASQADMLAADWIVVG